MIKGSKMSEEAKRKIGDASRGKPLSEEHKRRISESEKGKIVPEEVKRKISESSKGKYFSEEHKRHLSEAHKGKTISEETKQKISKTIKGRPAHNKGKPVSKETRQKLSGENSSRWKGGRNKDANGYVYLTGHYDHPRATHGKILEHIVVMEKKIGRHLKSGETVHHINGLKWDNRPENLELWSSRHHPGQRVEDVVNFAVDTYPELVIARLLKRLEFLNPESLDIQPS